MAKKSFTNNNPALNFIDVPEEDDEEVIAPYQHRTRGNPKGFRPDYRYIEKKEVRAQLLMKKSVFERAKTRARLNGQSFNDYVHSLIEKDLEEN